jgi:hypothetical protein
MALMSASIVSGRTEENTGEQANAVKRIDKFRVIIALPL